MTNLSTLFKQMWIQKRRYVYLLFLINIFVIVFTSGYVYLFRDYNIFSDLPANNLSQFWRYNFAGITLVTDLAFCVVTCWQNEKINLSQTWNLVSSDERKIYLANIFSSLIACGYFFFLQQIVNTMLLISTYGKDSLAYAFNQFGLYPIKMTSGVRSTFDQMFIFRWLFIILIILLIYFFTSFANFNSRVITDSLPIKSTLWIRLLIIAILVIIAVYFGSIFISKLNSFIGKRPSLQTSDPIWLSDLCLFVVNLVFCFANLIIVKKYLEPKINN